MEESRLMQPMEMVSKQTQKGVWHGAKGKKQQALDPLDSEPEVPRQ